MQGWVRTSPGRKIVMLCKVGLALSCMGVSWWWHLYDMREQVCIVVWLNIPACFGHDWMPFLISFSSSYDLCHLWMLVRSSPLASFLYLFSSFLVSSVLWGKVLMVVTIVCFSLSVSPSSVQSSIPSSLLLSHSSHTASLVFVPLAPAGGRGGMRLVFKMKTPDILSLEPKY